PLGQVQQIWHQGAQMLSELPDEVGKFFTNYQRPIIVLSLLLVAIISLKVVTAVLSAINGLPLVKPTFELIGFGYTLWFVYRYLLLSSRRQELVKVTQSLKQQVIGEVDFNLLPASSTEKLAIATQPSSLRKPLSTPPTPNKTISAIASFDSELERQFDLLIGTIRTIRNLRAEADVKPGVKVPVILQSENSEERQILEAGQSYIKDLAKVESLSVTPALEKELKTTMAGVIGTVQVLMPLAGVVDVDALQAKLAKDLAKVEAEIKSLSGRLANPNFVSKAKPEVVQGAKDALAEAQKQAEILRDRLNRLAAD
ncbi:MAG TPA: CAAD domain-containing protein, partial [Coleofasciculaceae cyanobacterium]